MYAVIETGGKQYKVSPDDVIEVEILDDKQKGSKINLEKVLLFVDKDILIGKPYLEGFNVECEVLEDFKEDKKIAFKYKRRKSYKKTKGHRQQKTRIKIEKIKKV